MRMHANSAKCLVVSDQTKIFSGSDLSKIRFILGAKFRKSTRGRFLGFAWLLLDPLIISMIYYFVFSVVKSSPNAPSILVGVTLYRIFQASIMSGIGALGDLNGGLKSERVRTRVILMAEMIYRIIDSTLQSILIIIIIISAFNASFFGGLGMLFAAQFSSVLFFGIGASIAPIVSKIPDLKNLVSYALRVGFYASPAMYPMSLMTGLHYKINEFNPFAYLAELVRSMMGLESTFNQLNQNMFFILCLLLVIMTAYGIRRFDALRWRMTTWA